MKPFSGLFWFTVAGGTLASGLCFFALLWFFETRLAEIAECRQVIVPECDGEAIARLYRAVCAAHVVGTLALFWLAWRIGRGLMPAPQASGNGGQ